MKGRPTSRRRRSWPSFAKAADRDVLAGHLQALRGVVETANRCETDLIGEREAWRAQAERLALAPPARRGWWPWRRSA